MVRIAVNAAHVRAKGGLRKASLDESGTIKTGDGLPVSQAYMHAQTVQKADICCA
jgi:hypothetical protein